MDFSSVPRALESLERRHPPLDERVLTLAKQLLSFSIQQKQKQPQPQPKPQQKQQEEEGSNSNRNRNRNDDFCTIVLQLLQSGEEESAASSSSSRNMTQKNDKSNDKNDTKSNDNDNDNDSPVDAKTIRLSRRWEPLAVGLYVATEILQQQIPRLEQQQQQQQQQQQPQQQQGVTTGEGVVYLEGPRVPSIVTTTTDADEEGGEEGTSHTTATTTTPSASTTPYSYHGWKSPVLSHAEILLLCETLHPLTLHHLEDSEPRVRTLVAKAAGVYCKVTLLLQNQPQENEDQRQQQRQSGERMRHQIHDRVLSSIQQHLVQGRAHAEQQQQPNQEATEQSNQDAPSPPPAVSSYSKSSTGALDDTTGWRALETNWQCLAAMISAMGPLYYREFGVFSTTLLQHCQHCCVVHVNRHVRAAGMAVLEQAIAAAVQSPTVYAPQLLSNSSSNSEFCQTVTTVLKHGLADNWSQVRMAASVLCRSFWRALQSVDADRTALYPVLLPRMCLNRFYLAQGVKLYSHETWRLLFATANTNTTSTTATMTATNNDPQPEPSSSSSSSGITYVVQYLPAVCRYYIQMCDADNHVVREAACQAIAELAIRLGEHDDYHGTLRPHVVTLLQALLLCFHDESWPVRDEACLACGILCRSYPDECRPELTTLWTRWTEQLTDPIWSVREDAAVALGDAVEAYGVEFYETKLQPLLQQLVPSAKQQPPMTLADYKARQNDAAAHTNSQLYSCGSLAPKLKKASSSSSSNNRKDGAGRIGGCSSCDVTRERQLWEATDGCIYVIRELVVRCSRPAANNDDKKSNNKNNVVPLCLTDAQLQDWLQQLVDVCRVRHFPQADDLRATLWRQVPVMAHALGKQRWKRHHYLELFLELLMNNLDPRATTSPLCHHAAGQCVEELAQFMGGVAMLRGRLEDDYQRDILDRVLHERQSLPRGPQNVMAVSPFGPPGLLDRVV